MNGPDPGLITVDEFDFVLDKSRTDDLIDGRLVPRLPDSPQHNRLRDALYRRLKPTVEFREFGTVLAGQAYVFDGDIYAPDLSILSLQRLELLEAGRDVQRFVPDLAIEILTEDQRFNPLWRKKERYRRAGVRDVWILSPMTREVFVYNERRTAILDMQDRLMTELMFGWWIAVRDVFRT